MAAKTWTLEGKTWTRRQLADGMVAVEVDVAKLDAAWSKDSIGYIGEDGKNELGNRVQRFIEWEAQGKPIEMPRIGYDKRMGRVVFDDGRHRTVAMRRRGVRRMMVMVSRGQAAAVSADLG